MTEEQKIKPPAHVEADRRRAEEREGNIAELKGWLEDQHRTALDNDPYGQFKYRTPLDVLKALDERERDQIRVFEHLTHDRLKPLAREKSDQRRVFVGAGGNAEDFDKDWENRGRDAHIAGTAFDNLERARRSSSVYD